MGAKAPLTRARPKVELSGSNAYLYPSESAGCLVALTVFKTAVGPLRGPR